jgi:hypothetical protein
VVVRTNLATRPSVKNSATQWFGPSGWARIAAGVHASLPRTTAFAGTTAGDVQMDRADAVPGKWMVYSISGRFVAPSTVRTNIDWYTSGGTYLSTTNGNLYDQAGSTTARMVSGVGQVPVDAGDDGMRPNITGVDGSMQLTGLLIEQYDSEAEATAALASHVDPAYYFDGDGNGVGVTGSDYAWVGTNGSSLSTYTFSVSPVLAGPLASPVGYIVAHRNAKGFALAGPLPSPVGVIGLFVTVSYDPTRGRVRVKATGLDPSVVRVVVSSRRAGTSRWTEVRGGRVAVDDEGAMVRTVDDYEFVAGEGVEYRLVALSSAEGAPDIVVQQRIASISDTEETNWIKFIATPYRNRRVVLTDWSEVSRKSRVALYDVVGRSQPVAVTDVHTGRQFSVDLVAHTLAEREALDTALGTGVPVFFQTPTSIACPSIYAVIGDYSYKRPARRSLRSIVTVQLIEISPPPPSVVGAGLTYRILGTQYGAYADLHAAVDTYAELGP